MRLHADILEGEMGIAWDVAAYHGIPAGVRFLEWARYVRKAYGVDSDAYRTRVVQAKPFFPLHRLLPEDFVSEVDESNKTAAYQKAGG